MFLKNINIKQPSVISLIITNLVLFGVAIYYDLSLFDILLIFWGETVVIGFFNFLKMLKTPRLPKVSEAFKTDEVSREELLVTGINFMYVFLKFFIIIWSSIMMTAFCMSQLVIIVVVFGDEEMRSAQEFPLQHFYSFLIGMIVMFISHGISFITNFISKREYETTKLRKLIFAPFRRILLVWIVCIGGGFLLLKLENDSFYLLIPYFLVKILFDLRQHYKEHIKAIN